MNLYEFEDYKAAIKSAVKNRGEDKKSLSLKRIAEKIKIQYTYLSKVLNDQKSHLNEDHLFAISELLHLLPDEIDYLFLLRSLAIATTTDRKTYLQNKINLYRRKQNLSVEMREFSGSHLNEEVNYLFDPLCLIIHVSLFIKDYREQPRRLCSVLGLSPERLQVSLRRLADLDFITLDEKGNVTEVMKNKMHYGTDHPLMRTHQQLLSSLSSAQFLRLNEGQKQRVMITFSSSQEMFPVLVEKFQKLMKEMESKVGESRSTHVYQMNFELFHWI